MPSWACLAGHVWLAIPGWACLGRHAWPGIWAVFVMLTIIFATFDIELYVVIYIVRYGGADGGVHITPNPPKTAKNPVQHTTTCVFSRKSSVRAENFDPEADSGCVRMPSGVSTCRSGARVLGPTTQTIDFKS